MWCKRSFSAGFDQHLTLTQIPEINYGQLCDEFHNTLLRHMVALEVCTATDWI